MVRQGYSEELALSQMPFDYNTMSSSIQLPIDQSIATLIMQTILYSNSTSDRAFDVRCLLIYKLTFPLISLFALFMPAPYCLSFRRDMPHFMIYLLSLGLLFCFLLLLQVAFILAKSHVVSPSVALGLPWIIAMGLACRNFWRITHGTT
jgi:lipopolysaccharide export LptBFGC system permease protein LptF